LLPDASGDVLVPDEPMSSARRKLRKRRQRTRIKR
jgi:hypothetical protein